MKILLTLPSLLKAEGKGLRQKSIWRCLVSLDVLEQHSLYSYLKTDQIGIEPGKKLIKFNLTKFSRQ